MSNIFYNFLYLFKYYVITPNIIDIKFIYLISKKYNGFIIPSFKLKTL